MEIKGKSILILGGSGLVGLAIARQLMQREPKRLVLTSLQEDELPPAMEELRKRFPGSGTEISGVHGNLFVRSSLSQAGRAELLGSAEYRQAIIEDILGPITPELLSRSRLHRTLCDARPDIVIDCVNTATALAYQDIYTSAQDVWRHMRDGHGVETFRDVLEKHLCTLYVPQLIRHIQILYESLLDARVRAYIKIGTSGTGGMGLNIPYTHSEERPSRVLLSKTAIAGAHTLLLFLMARTPDGPVVKEIKPAAAIGWKKIGFGPVRRGGRPIVLYDCAENDAVDLEREPDLGSSRRYRPVSDGDDGVLRSVYIDTGENGVFSRAEFEVVTALGQMEFVTPEEIARTVEFELRGINSGLDVVAALDRSSLGPTYRAGVLRETAIRKMRQLEREHDVRSVAFEMLGPPRLTKLLYEAELLRRTVGSMAELESTDAAGIGDVAATFLAEHTALRRAILSVGIPILLPDGRRLLRGEKMLVPKLEHTGRPTAQEIDRWAEQGWVDLRPANFVRWQERVRAIRTEIDGLDPEDTSSRLDHDHSHWRTEDPIEIGDVLAWLFIHEEKGMRLKS